MRLSIGVLWGRHQLTIPLKIAQNFQNNPSLCISCIFNKEMHCYFEILVTFLHLKKCEKLAFNLEKQTYLNKTK